MRSMRPADLLSTRLVNTPLARPEYVAIGLALMALKYAIDSSVIYFVTGIIWTPVDYLVPLLAFVGDKVAQFPTWLNVVLLVWTAPFVWIGVTLSVRRTLSAGISPWWVVAFFLPALNWLFMLVLALLPERVVRAAPPEPRRIARRSRPASFAWGTVAGAAAGLGLVALGVLGLKTYGVSLFMATPFVIGAVAGFVTSKLNRPALMTSVSAGVTAALVLALGLVGLALEGLICILMAAPIAIPIVALGAVIGHRLAEPRTAPGLGVGLMLLVLPAGSAVDAALDRPAERMVLTSMVIDAPPERVWPRVVGFDEIPEPPVWYFRLGLAYPLRARIDGEGPGAVRFCEFTTGAFREPITAWEAPSRLAFDVASQPPPLQEWSPYSRVYAPHQQNYFRTTRGEFRLVALPGGRTRLEGRTWYTLRIYPAAYWTVIADRIIHDIHNRVLRHIARRASAS